VRSPEVLAALRVGEQVYLADGAIEIRVSRAAPDKAECEVVAGGVARDPLTCVKNPRAKRRLEPHLPSAADRRSPPPKAGSAARAGCPNDLSRVRALLPSRDPPLLMATPIESATSRWSKPFVSRYEMARSVNSDGAPHTSAGRLRRPARKLRSRSSRAYRRAPCGPLPGWDQ
jgi:hypothetical protein